MAKIIKNPIELKLVFEHSDGTWQVDPSVHYGVSAEEYPELNQRKGMQVVLTPAQENMVKHFARDVVYPQILANEGISQ